ncbi:MAG: glycine cleavage system aminomethyltransferase GcvT [Actinomycetota bacterium]
MSNQVEAGAGLRTTPLNALHVELGAKLVPFAGWEMPIQYAPGVLAEHGWCRSSAGLFDVSHMAVVDLVGDDPAAALERLTPAGITTLAEGRQRYGLLLNDDGGIVDDFMVTNWGDRLTMVVNASRRDVDLALLREGLDGVEVIERTDVALVAIQGPEAAAVVIGLDPSLDGTVFLDNRNATVGGIAVKAARAGYTGEDGFELAVPADRADELARLLLEDDRVRPVGLGARDTLRLEAGLCLYGNDLDETISPVEADLVWSMPKRRREVGDFPGGQRVLRELADGPSRVRVGLQPDGRRPVREGAALRLADGDSRANDSTATDGNTNTGGSTATDGNTSVDGTADGIVSSGGFGPTVDRPVAMGYVPPSLAADGTALIADVRGKDAPVTVAPLPFVPHRYQRGA